MVYILLCIVLGAPLICLGFLYKNSVKEVNALTAYIGCARQSLGKEDGMT
jgi:hypothetical protein